MIKEIWTVLNAPLFKSKPKEFKIVVTLYCRYDFPELNEKAFAGALLDSSKEVKSIHQLIVLFFLLCPKDNNLVLIQDFTMFDRLRQPTYTLISEQAVPGEVYKKLLSYLPDGMFVIFANREAVYK